MPAKKDFLGRGWIPTPARHIDLLCDQMEKQIGFSLVKQLPLFQSAELPKVAMPWKSVEKFLPKSFEGEAQVGPDCTTHAIRNAANISRAVEIDIKGESEAFLGQIATEPTYAYRGSRGDGMNPGRAIEFYTKYGMLLRKKYPFGDFSSYGEESFSWAERNTPSQELLSEAAKHPFKYYLRARSVEEVKTALANGFGVIHGSMLGVDNVRKDKGRNGWTKNWSHCMCIGGYEETDDLYFLIINSWGIWNSGPYPDCGQIPGGSFMISADTLQRTWKSRTGFSAETWVLGNSIGFPAQKLPDYGTAQFLGS